MNMGVGTPTEGGTTVGAGVNNSSELETGKKGVSDGVGGSKLIMGGTEGREIRRSVNFNLEIQDGDARRGELCVESRIKKHICILGESGRVAGESREGALKLCNLFSLLQQCCPLRSR